MEQQSFISAFLLAPRYRAWRYLAILGFFGIVSVNMALMGYQSFMPLMGNNIYWITTATVLMYIVSMYFLLRVLVKHLRAGRFLRFAAGVTGIAILYTTLPNIVYAVYIDGYDPLAKSVVFDNLSQFVVFLLCIAGVIIPIFLRNWLIENQRLGQLKIRQESSRVAQFKEQINPSSFFKILNRSKHLTESDPGRASAMLMKLGQLLRYQLYDCNRGQVLLTAEVAFLRNFLELEKLYSPKLSFTITTAGDVAGVFVLPSVLLPFVQGMMNAFDEGRDEGRDAWAIDVSVSSGGKTVCVVLALSGIREGGVPAEEKAIIRKRLDTLYKNRYRLSAAKGRRKGETEVTLLLDKE